MQIHKLLLDLSSRPDNAQVHNKCLDVLGEIHDSDAAYFSQTRKQIWQLLDIVFKHDFVNHQQLEPLATLQIKLAYGINEKTLPAAEPDMLGRLGQDRLFLAVLQKTFNTDECFESFLQKLRAFLLCAHFGKFGWTDQHARLAMAMAMECFNNEYIFEESENELLRVRELEHSFQAKSSSGAISVNPAEFAVLAMYRPLSKLKSAGDIARQAFEVFDEWAGEAITRMIVEPLEEELLKNEIPTLGPISNPVSIQVRGQYEENPFPRWLNRGPPFPSLQARIAAHQPQKTQLLIHQEERLRILVAGCGTGQQPLGIAGGNPDAEVVAIDLSLASLAFAKRMAKRLEVNNVTFIHGDLSELSALDQRFHHVECVGVFNCMEDPFAGWRDVESVLLPGGTMHIGVYSRLARLPIEHVRRRIAALGLTPTPSHMKRMRSEILHDDRYKLIRKFLIERDFFSFSMFRDFLFHSHEHCFTLAEIKDIICSLGCDFLGFDVGRGLHRKYKELFPDDPEFSSFENWKSFERHYVGTREMYRVWLQKPEAVQSVPVS